MKASTDGKGEAKEDLTVASAQLAAGASAVKESSWQCRSTGITWSG